VLFRVRKVRQNMLEQNNTLLIEFLTEELPPINLEQNIANPFVNSIYEQLKGFLRENSNLQAIAAPRRFGCLIKGIDFLQANQLVQRKGPAIASGLKDGVPQPALIGFAKSCATEWQNLQQRDDGYFYYEAEVQGKNLADALPEFITVALKKIQIAKGMRWGNNEFQFVRPVHGLVVMFNNQVIPCEVFGLQSNNKTSGHRFMANAPVVFADAREYLDKLGSEGKVVAEFNSRKSVITEKLNTKASELGFSISHVEGLIDEVAALVEWPEVLLGEFDRKFLKVPQECLILSMAKNQKYFALLDKTGKLTNQFLFVSNLISRDPQVIINGNQKVLTARLADAEFFFEFDKRTPLHDFVNKMANVVYHNKLGSQLDRIKRLQQIVTNLAPQMGVDTQLAQKTAYLLKADLATEMVGEFPELQGVMGKYYALSSNESEAVANAIEKHYYPRFSGDELPDTPLALLMSLADKLETLVGIWGIGLIPTGDKDPYALRRAALGVVRILLSTGLNLKKLLQSTFAAFDGKNFEDKIIKEVYDFILQRLANYLASVDGYSTKVVNAAISSHELDFDSMGEKCINYLPGLLSVLSNFACNTDNQPLFQANKRIENILKKNAEAFENDKPVDNKLLHDPAEQVLYSLFHNDFKDGQSLLELKNAGNWNGYFNALSQFNQPLDIFFNDVMVMTDDKALRQNRLGLLNTLHRYFNLACKLSELA